MRLGEIGEGIKQTKKNPHRGWQQYGDYQREGWVGQVGEGKWGKWWWKGTRLWMISSQCNVQMSCCRIVHLNLYNFIDWYKPNKCNKKIAWTVVLERVSLMNIWIFPSEKISTHLHMFFRKVVVLSIFVFWVIVYCLSYMLWKFLWIGYRFFSILKILFK